MLVKFSGLNPKGPYLSLEMKNKIFVLCLPSPKRARDIRF